MGNDGEEVCPSIIQFSDLLEVENECDDLWGLMTK